MRPPAALHANYSIAPAIAVASEPGASQHVLMLAAQPWALAPGIAGVYVPAEAEGVVLKLPASAAALEGQRQLVRWDITSELGTGQVRLFLGPVG